MRCGFQEGASYQSSPLSTSILPSLLTSAMATPSARNRVSRTVFFQVMFVGVSGSAPGVTAGTATAARNRPPASQARALMVRPRGVVLAPPGRPPGETRAGPDRDDYGGCTSRVQRGRFAVMMTAGL